MTEPAWGSSVSTPFIVNSTSCNPCFWTIHITLQIKKFENTKDFCFHLSHLCWQISEVNYIKESDCWCEGKERYMFSTSFQIQRQRITSQIFFPSMEKSTAPGKSHWHAPSHQETSRWLLVGNARAVWKHNHFLKVANQGNKREK